jgi:hypothetical protein
MLSEHNHNLACLARSVTDFFSIRQPAMREIHSERHAARDEPVGLARGQGVPFLCLRPFG